MKEIYVVRYDWNNDGEYEDFWEATDIFGVFKTFRDACDAIQHVVDKHKYISDNKIEDRHGDCLEFCEYEEKYDEVTGILTVSWWMRSGGYMEDYCQSFTVTKMEIGKFDPDIDPGF